MKNEVPNFDHEKLAELAMDLYGIEGEISSLASFEDQNASIKTSTGNYVLKIANKRWPHEELDLQTLVLEHLQATAPEVTCPQTIASKSGEAITMVDEFAVRLVTFLEGQILAEVARSPELNHDLGRFMGRFTMAMESFNHPISERPNDFWNLDNVLACRIHLEDIIGDEDRERIHGYFERYEKDVYPKTKHLQKSVIHNDANEQNLLVASDNPTRIAGLIDFGDLQRASHINELAITLAYALLGQDKFDSTARQIIKGYTEVITLEPLESEVLMDLMAMRLVQSITLSSHWAKQCPDNKYIVSSQQPARELLKKLENYDWE